MSNAKYYWFSLIQKVLRHYPAIDDGSIQGAVFANAIRLAMKETEAMPDGERRLELIRMLYFRKSHNVEGAAMALYISEHTAINWNQKFVYSVAKKAGFWNVEGDK